MGWGKVFQNIYFYNQQNPKYSTLQSVFTETALRPETSPGTMWIVTQCSLLNKIFYGNGRTTRIEGDPEFWQQARAKPAADLNQMMSNEAWESRRAAAAADRHRVEWCEI